MEIQALAKEHTSGVLDAQMRRATGLTFFNTSQYDLEQLLRDPDLLRENLIE